MMRRVDGSMVIKLVEAVCRGASVLRTCVVGCVDILLVVNFSVAGSVVIIFVDGNVDNLVLLVGGGGSVVMSFVDDGEDNVVVESVAGQILSL